MGPRQDAGEDSALTMYVTAATSASMGPRQDAGEDYSNVLEDCEVGGGFNGAPAGCRGRPRPVCHKALQKKASMGPRQDAGED